MLLVLLCGTFKALVCVFFLRTKPSTLQRKRVNVCFRSVRCTGSHSVCRGCRLGTSQLVFSGMDHLFTRFLLFSKQRQLRHLLTPRWPVKAEGQTWGQLWTLLARCKLPCRIIVFFFLHLIHSYTIWEGEMATESRQPARFVRHLRFLWHFTMLPVLSLSFLFSSIDVSLFAPSVTHVDRMLFHSLFWNM